MHTVYAGIYVYLYICMNIYSADRQKAGAFRITLIFVVSVSVSSHTRYQSGL